MSPADYRTSGSTTTNTYSNVGQYSKIILNEITLILIYIWLKRYLEKQGIISDVRGSSSWHTLNTNLLSYLSNIPHFYQLAAIHSHPIRVTSLRYLRSVLLVPEWGNSDRVRMAHIQLIHRTWTNYTLQYVLFLLIGCTIYDG